MLPTMLKKRAEIQKQRKVSDGYLRELLHESSRQAARSRLRRIQDELRRRIS